MQNLGKNETVKLMKKIKAGAEQVKEWIEAEYVNTDNAADVMLPMATVIETLNEIVPEMLYKQYSEFFKVLGGFCKQCADIECLETNKSELNSSLELFEECIEELLNDYVSKVRICPVCGREVVYNPLPDYYRKMAEKYQAPDGSRLETLNKEEYSCPYCGTSDRDRLIISFLRKAGLPEAPEGMRVLQFAPAIGISAWIKKNCPHITYETTDLYMDQVSFQSDIMNMKGVLDETYDVMICSHVLDHVRDDRQALREMKRILKPDGKIVFLVPVDLNIAGVDEEWGLSEAENWRRFGQGDHCRAYGKDGLMERLEEEFYVHCLGKEYFGEDIFQQSALTDTSMLYILTKSEQVSLKLSEEIQIDQALCHNGPLVSVILPCYNHEKYVAEAIESIINQSYKNIEIIAGDDGSTDGTAAVMKKYSSYFAKEFYAEKNTDLRLWEYMRGIAQGKYIAIAHSDDIWEKDKLALQVAYMESHPECGACFTWCRYRDEEGKELNDLIFIQPNRTPYEWMNFFWKHGNVLCHPSLLMRRDIDARRKQQAGRQLPDFFRWLEVVQMSSIHIIPKVLVRMRQHQGCTSFPLTETLIRTQMEAACGWMWALRNMDDDFFKKSFGSLLRNPKADTPEEIQCEKFFLLLGATNPLLQYSAMYYYFGIFDQVVKCLENTYHFTTSDFAKEMTRISREIGMDEKAVLKI